MAEAMRQKKIGSQRASVASGCQHNLRFFAIVKKKKEEKEGNRREMSDILRIALAVSGGDSVTNQNVNDVVYKPPYIIFSAYEEEVWRIKRQRNMAPA